MERYIFLASASAARSTLFIVSVIVVFFVCMLLSGCSGNSGSGLPGATNPSDIESTVSEQSSTVVKISSVTGGTFTHKNLTITIPPNALEEDTFIKISLVSILRNGVIQSNGDCYKISTNSEDNIQELNESATVTIAVDASFTTPSLYLWDGEDWINPDAQFNSINRTLTFKMNCIYEDLNDWMEYGSGLQGPSVFQIGEASLSQGIKAAVATANSNIVVMSSKKRFRIECTESQRRFAEMLGGYLEAGYDYYVSKGFKAPVRFILDSEDADAATPKEYIYVKISYSENGTAHADSKGIIKLPTSLVDTAARQTASLHELFHLVEYSYSNRRDWEDWLSESETEGISTFACNQIFNQNSFYDINSKDSFFPSQKGFIYALDKFSSDEVWQYQNAVFWGYVMGNYGGVDKFRAFLVNSNVHDLAWLDSMCKSQLNESLSTVYAKAYEDYYIYGQFFNNVNFYRLSSRKSGQPYYSERQDVFSSANPYKQGQTFSIEHMSGKNIMLSNASSEGAAGKTGILSITLKGKVETTKVKLFYFSFSAESGYELISQEEIQGSSKKVTIGTDITDVFLIFENLSFAQDNQIFLSAFALEN